MSQSPPTVLIIDDEHGVTTVFRLVLTRAGFKVLVAEHGEAGLESAERELPSLIFCDELMPILDGYETLLKLKNNPATADIPVIMMGGTHPQGLRNWVSEGAVAFVAKPFAIAEVMALIRRLVTSESTPAR